MKIHSKIYPVSPSIFAGLILLLLPSVGISTETQKHQYKQRLSKLHEKIDRVAATLDRAEGFPKRAGNIDLQVAKFFAEYVAWELEHPDLMKDVLLSSEVFSENPKTDNEERESRYWRHIDRELTGSMKILDQALARFKTDVDWPDARDIDWAEMKFDDGNFRVDGRPVFPGGFNMVARGLTDLERNPEWAEKEDASLRPFLQKMRTLGVGVVGTGISVPGLLDKDGGVSEEHIAKFVERIKWYERLGLKVDVLLHWKGDRATLNRHWPGMAEYYGNGVYLDIDHPGVRPLVAKVMAKLMPALRDQPAVLSWDLANEPFFYLTMWSPHALKKYRDWLAGQYKTIERLNAVWKTDYAGFDAIPLPKEKPREKCSPGEWYDRVTFHSLRVADFFSLVRDEMRKHDPKAVIHLKGQDNSSLGPLPEAVDDGIDREMLTPLADLHGLDTRPLPVTEPRMAAGHHQGSSATVLKYDDSPYGFHWLGQSFLYDYLTSLKPYRPIVDFEYHAFSINAIRVEDIPQSHARASLWMAHMHGLVGNVAWYWHRRYGPYPFPGKYFKTWLHGSMSTQPLVAASYFQTMLRLNCLSEEVTALASAPERPVRLFVSKPSYIQNQAHINALHRAYEGLCFHGLRIGFVTEKTLAEDGVPDDCKLIVIPDAEYVAKPALKALQQAGENGVKLVRLGKLKPAYDAHGIPHAAETVAFLDDTPILDYAAAPELSAKFEKLLRPLTAEVPVHVEVVDSQGSFGVMHRLAKVNGELVMLLVNLSDKPVKVRLTAKDGRVVDGYDMLNREAVKGSGVDMPLQGVRLIRVANRL